MKFKHKAKQLTIKNFMSFGAVPTIISLERPGTTLILGEDLDNSSSGEGSNGVGKTTIINAIVYACFDKPLSDDITKDDLINNINKKNLEIVYEFETDEKAYLIRRARKLKTSSGESGNFVQLFEDGKDISLDSTNRTNDLIKQIIGIPYELFVRIIAFSANHIPFLNLSGPMQIDIIEELFDLKMLTKKADLLKELIKSTESEFNLKVASIEHIKHESERMAGQIESAVRRVETWEIQNAREIEAIKITLQKINNVDIDQQMAYKRELDVIDKHINEISSQQRSIDRDRKSKIKTIADITNQLKHLRDKKCPYCLQLYEGAENKINDLEVQQQDAEQNAITLDEQYTALEDDLKELSDKRKEVAVSITVDNLNELIEIKARSAHLTKKLEDLQMAKNPYTEPLEELRAIKIEEPDYNAANEFKTSIEHQKFLLKLLTRKDSFLRKALLDKSLSYLNQRLASYLVELGLPHMVEFTHDMKVSITKFGRTLGFGNLSNGQRSRINLALSFAFRDVLQNMHGRVSMCMLDEVLDVGLDTLGIQAAAKMLKDRAKVEGTSLFVISHRDEVGNMFDRRITVQMSKNFSYIKEE
jgi:DNA repair exonuclease SbcCD ATPase subunit